MGCAGGRIVGQRRIEYERDFACEEVVAAIREPGPLRYGDAIADRIVDTQGGCLPRIRSDQEVTGVRGGCRMGIDEVLPCCGSEIPKSGAQAWGCRRGGNEL
jgi:hypothetical protein